MFAMIIFKVGSACGAQRLRRRHRCEERQQAIPYGLVGFAVLGAGAETGERIQVIAGAITLIPGQAVLRKHSVEFCHVRITLHFGHN